MIEKNSAEMYHDQLYSILLGQIREGVIGPGERVPSERALGEMYGVSRITVKTAVLRLMNEGLVVRATGKGTFVSSSLDPKRVQASRTGNVAFVLNKRSEHRVPLLEDAMYLSLSQSIETEMADNGMHIMIATVDEQNVREVNLYKAMVEKVDGLIIAEPRDHQLADLAVAQNRPVVLATPSEHRPTFDSVDIDNEQAGVEATNYLLKLGHTRIAYIKGPETIVATQTRFGGHLRALADAGVAPDRGLHVAADGWTIGHGSRAFKRLLDTGLSFTAAICSNDLLAIGVLQAAAEARLSVPSDLSVIGCDNIELAEHAAPPLTTLDAHVRFIGQVAARRLLDRLRGDDGPEQRILLPAALVERESCARVN